jgi:hypothetical protein
MKVIGIGLEHSRELLLMQDEEMIKTLAAHAPQETLTAGVGTWCADRCPQEFDSGPARHLGKERAKLRIVVTDQESRLWWLLSRSGQKTAL